MEYPNLPHAHGKNESLNEFVSTEISKTKNFEAVSNFFSQLSDPSRLKIFWLLCHRSECVINIAAMVDMSTPAVSHHLKLLKAGGLVECSREGKEVFYRASDSSECRVLHQVIEKILSIACPDFGGEEYINSESEHSSVHVDRIKQVHDFLVSNLDKRITIEELSKQFYINPTTLKNVFKSVYGVSIAAHINHHRMEKAAELLVKTENSISEVAEKVGYESQSKFTQVFKSEYGMSPSEYRTKNKISLGE